MENPRLDQAQMIRMWTLVVLRVLVALVSFILVILMLYMLSTVLLLLILSVFFCYMIAPFVRLFEQPVYVAGRELKLPRGLAIMLVYASLGVVLTLLLQLVIPILWEQGTELGRNLPNYTARATAAVSQAFNDANSWLRHFRVPSQWKDYAIAQATHMAESLFPWLQALFWGTISHIPYLLWLILVPILSFFMLKDAAAFEQWLVALMPNERLKKRAHWLLLDVSQTLAAYIRAQLTSCLVVGAMVTVGLALLGVPYALVLGLVAGVLEFVPLVGPLVAAIIAFSLSLTTSLRLALLVAAFLIVLRIIQDYIIYPRIIGLGIKMHPVVVVVAILAGAEIGGLSGIFLAIPVVGLTIVAYNHYLAYRRIEALAPAPNSENGPPGQEPRLMASASSPSPASTTTVLDN